MSLVSNTDVVVTRRAACHHLSRWKRSNIHAIYQVGPLAGLHSRFLENACRSVGAGADDVWGGDACVARPRPYGTIRFLLLVSKKLPVQALAALLRDTQTQECDAYPSLPITLDSLLAYQYTYP